MATKAVSKRTPTKTPTRKRKPRSDSKHDYALAQQWYVEGKPDDEEEPDGNRSWLTMRVIAEELDIPYQRIKERAASERWTELKATYQRQAAIDRQRRRMEQMGKNSIEFDDQSFNIAKMGQFTIGARLAEITKMIQATKDRRDDVTARLRAGEHVAKEEMWFIVRSSELIELARAAETFQTIGRKALGTDIERISIEANVEVEHAMSVAAELERDDPDRLAAFMSALERAGLLEKFELLSGGDDEDDDEPDDIEDAVIVEDEDEPA